MSAFSNFPRVKFEKAYKVRGIMVNFKRDLISYLNLPRIDNLNDLAYFLTYTKDQLNRFMFDKKNQYVTFEIPKKNSNLKRKINAPKKCLKMAQKIILVEILEKIPCSKQSTAFVKKENGLIKNALVHSPNVFLLKLDFKDFFQSIKIGCINKLFSNLGYNSDVAANLSSLCTYRGELPQGGICSPYLSNLVCYELDLKISKYCASKNIAYTRYADDLMFSANDISLLKELKIELHKIIKACHNEDFQISINENKTKLIKNTSHKKVTGITINDRKIKAPKAMKNTIRQELFFSLKNNVQENKEMIGMIAYVKLIEPDYASKINNYAKHLVKKMSINAANNNLLKIIYKMTA